jgi:hypothetical protein
MGIAIPFYDFLAKDNKSSDWNSQSRAGDKQLLM